MLRIVADANIPLAEAAVAGLGTARRMPGHAIGRDAVRDADVLLVRSVTPVGRDLLDGTPVRFVGTATAGTDHVDGAALDALGVAWVAAPGSNAASVVDWVLAALLATAAERGEALATTPGGAARVLGIVGVGQVGGRLARRARALGFDLRLCDPPRARAAQARGEAHAFELLDAVLGASDIVSVHTPYTTSGPDATHHLLGADALARLPRGAWVVNAARGRIADGEALLDALARGHVAEALLDVWPGEPSPHRALAERCRVATPHVAGYAADAKVRGTSMVVAALRDWLRADGADLARGLAPGALDAWDADAAFDAPRPAVLAPPPVPTPRPGSPAAAAYLDALARQGYAIRADTGRFRDGIPWDAPAEARAAAFADLRKTYPLRREWSRLDVLGAVPPALRGAVADGLGMGVDG